MPNIDTYIEQFGNIPFSEMPFNDADNLALNNIFYMPIEKVAPSEFEEKPKTLGHYAQAFYAMHNYKHVPAGLVLPKIICRRLVKMSSCRRFAAIKVTAVQNTIDTENTVQFAAATFILPNKMNLILYRGTDDSVCGWVEDFDLLIKGKTGSHDLAINYLENAAKSLKGDFIVAGHSKGGHMALYASLSCSDETRKRIKRVYNNDGPGFADGTLLTGDEYKELLPKYRHFVPDSSTFGIMMHHDNDFKIVKSSFPLLGLVQHDLGTWQLDGAMPVLRDELSLMGKIQDVAFEKVINEAGIENFTGFRNILNNTFEATGADCLLQFGKTIATSVPKMICGFRKQDATDKKQFWNSTFSIIKNVTKTSIEAIKGELVYPVVH